MSLHDFAELFASLGVMLVGLSGLSIGIMLLGRPYDNAGVPALTWRAKGPKYLLEDLHNPKAAFGGILGLTLWLAKLGAMSMMIGGLCWVVWYVAR